MHQRTTIGDRSLHLMWVLGMELWDHACREHLSPSEPSHRLRQKAFKVLFKIQLFSRTVLTFYGYSSLQTLRSCEPYFFLSKQTETFTQTWGWQLRLVFVLFLSFPLQSLPWERTHLPVPHKVCREIAPSPGPWTTRAEKRLLEVKSWGWCGATLCRGYQHLTGSVASRWAMALVPISPFHSLLHV